MELGVLDVSVTKGASNCSNIPNPLEFWAPIWGISMYCDFGGNFFAWGVRATSTSTGFELALSMARVIWTTKPKPAYGGKGLDWIVRPEYSFGGFSMSHFGWVGGEDKMLQTDKQTDATLRGWGVGAGNEQNVTDAFSWFTGGPKWTFRCLEFY